MELTQIRSHLETLINLIDDEIAREAPPEISAAEFINQARVICTAFEGPTPDDEMLNQFYRDTGGNLALMRLLASRIVWKEDKEGEPLKSPGGYMRSILRNANRRDLLEEANRKFGDVTDDEAEDEDDGEDEVEETTPAIVEQVMKTTKQRLSKKPVMP